MTTIVISQPMFLPWRGLFEQIAAADDYVHYDNVQLPMGRSFTNRVQVKSETGVMWLTVPILRSGKQLIMDVEIDHEQPWRSRHLRTIHHLYSKARYYKEVIDVIHRIYENDTKSLSEFNIFAIEYIAQWLGLNTRFHRSSEHPPHGAKSEGLMDIIQTYQADKYITGHGARHYLDHEYFERHHVGVYYMRYQKLPHKQLHGDFTPYVSIIDLLCNEGLQARNFLIPVTQPWRDFIHESN
ncbi:WbqC family protein [Cohnella suwonensis]|uniref:WbqC family protein n=1 Tax=Cohnella suwonensis TaxID=696072 RepID=A0ABW0LXM4_9BACL